MVSLNHKVVIHFFREGVIEFYDSKRIHTYHVLLCDSL